MFFQLSTFVYCIVLYCTVLLTAAYCFKKMQDIWPDKFSITIMNSSHNTFWKEISGKQTNTSVGTSTLVNWFVHMYYFVVPKWKASLKRSHFRLNKNIQCNNDNFEHAWIKFSVTFPGMVVTLQYVCNIWSSILWMWPHLLTHYDAIWLFFF